MTSLAKHLATNKRFDFSCSACEKDKFDVIVMDGYEAISRPFRFTLTLVSDDGAIDFDAMLQATATLRIYPPDGGDATSYHGVVAAFEQLHQAGGYTFYQAVLVPRLWRLSLSRISEVYLNEQTIPQIIVGLLREHHLSSADVEWRLTGAYRARSFVCQYQETPLDFISRWLEKEGMAYFFDHSGSSDKLVIVDDKRMHPAQALKVQYRPVDTLDTGSSDDSLQSFICRQQPLPQTVVLQEYNHRKASLALKFSATVAPQGFGEVMLYGENFRDEAEGQRYARLRAEEIRCGGTTFSGEGTATGLRSGYYMDLAHHYRDDFNGRYLVTEVTHSGTQAGALLNGMHHPYGETEHGTAYRVTLTAIPADTQFRPARLTPKPRIAGTMTASIDAEGSGGYADLDEFGQYKVQLPFDRSDKAADKGSARIRMASPYAGHDYGLHFPLRKKAEVLLAFADGDPDQPVIMAAVPNSENPGPVNNQNPSQNRLGTAGGNHFYLDDATDKTCIWLRSPYQNTQLGLGATATQEAKPGLWSSTAGSATSITGGESRSVFKGPWTTVNLAMRSTLSTAAALGMGLGSTVSYRASTDLAWTKGRRLTIDEGESLALHGSGRVQAEDSLTLSGGQRPSVKSAVDQIKAQARTQLERNITANQTAATEAASAIIPAPQPPQSPAPLWQAGSNGVSKAHGLLANLSAEAAHQALETAAQGIADTVRQARAYASNIQVNGQGIQLTVDQLQPEGDSAVAIQATAVRIHSQTQVPPQTSAIDLSPTAIQLAAKQAGPESSSLQLSGNQAELATANPNGSLVFHHPLGGQATLAQDGWVLRSGAAQLAVEKGQGGTLKMGKAGVYVTPNQILAEYGKTSLSLTPTEARLELAASGLTVSPGGLTLNGSLIRLG